MIEDGSGQSHVAIVAKALGIAAVGQAEGIVERVTAGDAIIVDARARRGARPAVGGGRVGLHRQGALSRAASEAVRGAARRAGRDQGRPAHRRCRSMPACSPTCRTSGSRRDGVGLFRTELMFMLSHTLPRARPAGAGLRGGSGRSSGQAGGVPLARHRRRQDRCPICVTFRRRTRPSAGARSACRSTGRRCSACRSARFCGRLRAGSCES